MSPTDGEELALLRSVFDGALARDRPAALDPDPHTAAALPPAWSHAVALGWPQIALPESLGGAGGSVAPLAALAEATGRHAVSTPIVPAALARWALHRAGHEPPAADAVPVLCAVGDGAIDVRARTVEGIARRVPWARFADLAVVYGAAGGAAPAALVDLTGAGIAVVPGANLAGEPRDDVVLLGAPCVPLAGPSLEEAEAYAGLVVAAATLGALQAARRATREHATARSQFDRPLARFQLVAAHLAQIGGLVEVAQVVVADAVGAHDDGVRAAERSAIAKAWTARAAGEVAARAHQVHGAIGVTREHALHLWTRRLWAWRDEWGSETEWERRLGRMAIEQGPGAAWDLITA